MPAATEGAALKRSRSGHAPHGGKDVMHADAALPAQLILPPAAEAHAAADGAAAAAAAAAAAVAAGIAAAAAPAVPAPGAAATAGAPSTSAAPSPGVVTLPLVIDTVVNTQWRDGKFYKGRVVDRRKRPNAKDDTDYEYYMHYINMNRRMDDWVTTDMLDFSFVMFDGVDEKSRNQKRKFEDDHGEEHGDFDANAIREHEEFTKVKNIERIELGRFEMETWYFSPFPAEFNDCKKLYICEFTLAFFKTRDQLLRHVRKVKLRRPPGDEIYRCGNVSMFEVDGRKEKIFCQNLCFLAKLFLDHKTLYYDVDLFLFYVLCECDERGAHMVGYFSKEKKSEEGYNLACILTLPAYQRKGYGKALISFSYELSRLEKKVGTPEKPLSDLGLVSYRGYWTRIILNVLKDHQGTISIRDLADMTFIRCEDIISTLQHLNLIRYLKGQHVICAAPKLVEQHLKAAGSVGLYVDPNKIIWTPYNPDREYEKQQKN